MASLVGQPAPAFKGDAAFKGEFKSISLADYKGKWLIFFFYPLDFTFVCPTEVTSLSDQLEEFHQRGAEVLGCSVDSKFSHQAWLNQPRNQGGIQGTQYPILSDINKTIASDYGVLLEPAGIALRGLFLIDPDGVVQAAMVNNLPIGRSTAEVLRLLDAAQEAKKGVVCPMNYQKGKESINPKQAKDWFAKNAK